jgi:predicted P-loop ATPase
MMPEKHINVVELPRWGATPDEWRHFIALGLGAHMLPVVSNPKAVIASRSTLSGVGKVPSIYDSAGEVVGFQKWSEKHSNERELARWQKQRDYGICLQARVVRALDVDVTVPERAEAITAWIDEQLSLLGPEPPRRERADSSKFLLAFLCDTPLTKRTVAVEGGAIELLADGQQFIAAGTHPSGARYTWRGGLPEDIPSIEPEVLEMLWDGLVEEFGTAPPVSANASRGALAPRVAPEKPDPVAQFLIDGGWVKSATGDGRLNVICPFEDEHSEGPGSETSTQYMMAGVGGYAQGHWKCMHAHCLHRTDADFLEAVGYVAAGFEDISGELGIKNEALWPNLPRVGKDKQVEPILNHLIAAVSSGAMSGAYIAADDFKDEILVRTKRGGGWRTFNDNDYVRLRSRLEALAFKPISQDRMRDAVSFVADEHRFDSQVAWCESLVWDGVPRVDQFFKDYVKVDNNPEYARAVARYLFTALAGRSLQPGCKADMVPIFCGDQGIGKSQAVAALAPDPDRYVELSVGDPDNARKMKGAVMGEFAELQGLANRDMETTKAFITRTHEAWVPKYKEFTRTYPRRIVFIGTSNRYEFLADETGNRRWLPLCVTSIDLEAIKRDVVQLWAEGVSLFLEHGVDYADAQRLAQDVHEQHTLSDSWEDSVRAWLDADTTFDELVGLNADAGIGARWALKHRVGSVLVGAIGMEPRHIRRGDEMRIARVLRRLGFERKTGRADGEVCKYWEKLGGD